MGLSVDLQDSVRVVGLGGVKLTFQQGGELSGLGEDSAFSLSDGN